MSEQPIFEFSDPVEFLGSAFRELQRKNPQFSMRAWARALKLSHVAMLSMVLGRKRRLLPSLSSRISQDFLARGYFTETEARYFDILVLFNNAESTEEKSFYQRILSELRPDRQFSTLQLDRLRTISDWYHFAILEMTYLADFQSDPRWISLRLGDGVSEGQVKEAIERLLRLGLLERTETGLKKTSAQLATPTDIPDESLRELHRGLLLKAITALEEQPAHARDITGHMLVTSREKLPEAKRMIQKFRRELAKFLETPGGDAVYQINIQLFSVLGGSENVEDQ